MSNGRSRIPVPSNEPVRPYGPGSPEKASLKSQLVTMREAEIDVPLIIGGEEVRTGDTGRMVCPHSHQTVLGTFHKAGFAELERAVAASQEAWQTWSRTPWEERAAVLLRAAELLAGPWRDRLNAATMLGQSKNVFQAEIDSACELIDFWRFNPHYAEALYHEQPMVSPRGVWNQTEQRPLEGYVAAVTPFNFTSIAGNLPTAPILMGNTVLWKPASSAVYSAWFIYKLLEEAGLPAGVLNFVPGSGRVIGDALIDNEHLAGVHFTGSTGVFQNMWRSIGQNIAKYRSYPRIVGETGGKDFVLAHSSADPLALSTALLRGAFEYQGQKCSAASRAYIPESLWGEVKERLLADLKTLKMGDVEDFTNFINAVIDESAFESISAYIDAAKAAPDAEIIAGGGCNKEVGYFIEPTVVVTTNPKFKTMCEEIFGPVLTIYVYPDAQYAETLALCDSTSPYALTGAIFARDRQAVMQARAALVHAAGNFYINDKPTGAVVGQQPFGGGRASGTNDKAGSPLNLLRWVSQRTVKETFVPPTDYRYPFLGER